MTIQELVDHYALEYIKPGLPEMKRRHCWDVLHEHWSRTIQLAKKMGTHLEPERTVRQILLDGANELVSRASDHGMTVGRALRDEDLY